MVAAESSFSIPSEEVHLVSQRKYNLDEGRPWWETAFFRLVWLPVVRFGFKWMHVAAPSAMRPDGSIVLIEQQGVYFDKERAARTCENEFWTVKTLPIDIPLPKESVQYKGHRSPQSVMPDRYRRRTFPAPVPVHQLKQIERAFKTISEKATGI